MTRVLPSVCLALTLGASPALAQDSADLPAQPEEPAAGFLWVPAVTTALAGVVFMAATLDAAGDDEFGRQRSLAAECLRDSDSPACARLSEVGFAYASAADPRLSICDPEVAADYRITEECDERGRIQRQYRLYLSLSVLSFAASVGMFIGYLVKSHRTATRATARTLLRPWLMAARDGASGGLGLRHTF
jgi:hypothetical protein